MAPTYDLNQVSLLHPSLKAQIEAVLAGKITDAETVDDVMEEVSLATSHYNKIARRDDDLEFRLRRFVDQRRC